MVNTVNNLNFSQLQNISGKNLSQLLKVGQELNVSIDKIDGNKVELKIGNQTLTALTQDKSISLGPAKIQVTQTQPQLMVSLLKESATSQDSKALSQQQIMQNTLRQILPNQASISQTFAQLSQLTNLPQPLQAPLQQLLELLKKPTQSLNGKELKQSIENSGVFFESKIKQLPAGNQTLQQDVKAQLSALLRQTQNSPIQNANVKQLTEGLVQAINRITHQQIQQLENQFAMQIQLLREHDEQNIEEQLEFKKSQNNYGDSWQVWIQADLPEGNLQAKLHLQTRHSQNATQDSTQQLLCVFWCENEEFKQRLKENLPQLELLLTELGLDSVNLQLSNTQFNFEKEKQTLSKNQLIDIKI